MNAHLTERFGVPHTNDDGYPDPEITPLARPSRMNNDIHKYQENAKKPVVNAGSWIEKPEVPTSAELMVNCQISFPDETIIDLEEELRPNRIDGPYQSNEEYLGTQYELLREDAIRPLRQAIEEVRRNPWWNESKYPPSRAIGIYEPVSGRAITCTE